MKAVTIVSAAICLQCFDTVGWVAGNYPTAYYFGWQEA